jgi:ATP-dependent helicase HrpB
MILDVSRAALPIDQALPSVRAALSSHRAVVVRAAPGAGKTTRVPPAVADHGRVIVLQPRRIAARSVARRIAQEQGWTLGHEVGWHVRFDRQARVDTRVLLVTEGMLTAYLTDDPLLSDITTVVLDEFHERSLHTDVGLLLVRQAWRARDDLRLVVMSATLDADPISRYLEGCPVIDAPGTLHPLTVEYAPGASLPAVVQQAVASTDGQILCFLPGAADIERARVALTADAALRQVDVMPLHGGLSAEAQDAALRPSRTRRVILATNIAETSLTVPDVSVVIDTGLQKVARYDAARAIDALVLERIAQDSADQRAGRAARLGPGRVWRLWDARDRLRPSREPEIHRVDLAPVLLPLVAAGERPNDLDWFDPPTADRLDAARILLMRLGAIDDDAVTPLGHRLRQLPLHPRLARVLAAAEGHRDAARVCALLSEGTRANAEGATTSCDLLPWLDRWPQGVPLHVQRIAEQLERMGQNVCAASDAIGRRTSTPSPARRISDEALQRALLAGYPDRVARRREGSATRYLLGSGRGAQLGRDSRVVQQSWLVALDVAASQTSGAESVIHLASAIEPEWLTGARESIRHWYDADSDTVKAARVVEWEALVIREHPCAPDAATRAQLLAEEWMRRATPEHVTQWMHRAAFAGVAIDLSALVRDAAQGATSVEALDPVSAVPWNVQQRLAAHAPETLLLPSGRTTRLDYRADGSVHAAVKLQELFGLADTPLLGPQHVPLVFALLSPGGRPVQTTRDLRSFWTSTYAEVRKELRGRYPRHPWPEDPWTATPTHRTTRAATNR